MDTRNKGDGQGHADRMLIAVQKEVAVLKLLPKSENLVQFHEYYMSGGLCYMVMENGGGGLLRGLEGMQVLSEQALQPVFHDMMSAIAACHAAGIVHRDIKPDNFLATSTASGLAIKLCDFGLSSKVSDVSAPELEGVFGTPPFMAPEMLAGMPHSGTVDVWAMGVVAYVLLFGAWPYTPAVMTGKAMKAAIQMGVPAPRFRSKQGLPGVSRPCSEWVEALLRRDVLTRPSAQAALRLPGLSAAWSTETSMRPAVNAANRCGAFGTVGRCGRPSPLDQELSQMNVAVHSGNGAQGCDDRQKGGTSEASTTDSPAH